MSGLMEVVHPGIGTTLQDAGRPGLRHEGMPVSGWLDARLARAANALLGNAEGQAVLELRGVGTELRVKSGPVRVALTGEVQALWTRADDSTQPLLPWRSASLQVGDRIRLGPAQTGCAYLAVSGGCQVQPQLASRSSYWRAGLQGVLGRALQPGDELPCECSASAQPQEAALEPLALREAGPLRVILGPQHDHFDSAVLEQFLQQTWTASREQDRMGMRLQGEPLRHRSSACADIVSDGVTPGAIQVPANGLPIVLMADSQTVGGYPKIATVIRADLPRLAHLKAASPLRFESVSVEQAAQALHSQAMQLKDWLASASFFTPPGYIDEQALYTCNLISGMVNMRRP